VVIGAHVSAAGGIEKAVSRAVEMGAEAMQVFPSSPRAWAFKAPTDQTVAAFKKAATEAKLGPTVFHAVYLVALGAPDEGLVAKSVESLINYLKTADRLGAAGVVFHPASHRGAGYDAVEAQIVGAVHLILKQAPGAAWLAIENSAGMGDHIGSKFEQLGRLVKAIDRPRVRVCLDTQHMWAANYDVATPNGLDEALNEFDKHVGLKLLAAVHANDSKTPRGSGVDRHENIGQGMIGAEGFKTILRNKELTRAPLYLEVPGFEDTGPDKKNVDILKKIRQEISGGK
jgi:deoxyribonuclease-4